MAFHRYCSCRILACRTREVSRVEKVTVTLSSHLSANLVPDHCIFVLPCISDKSGSTIVHIHVIKDSS